MGNSTNSTSKGTAHHVTNCQQIIITTCYLIGIFGNSLAIIFLRKKGTRPNNQKHRLMLTCLSVNDLTAMLGMSVLMYTQLYWTTEGDIWLCSIRVIWRVFGLGSGCVTVVMAIERWLALTKPFFYQKHVTMVLLRRCIFGLWGSAVLLVCLPLFGFGLFYESNKCKRYREATLFKDIAYAYLYFTLGILLCICIVFCNVAVMRELCNKGFQKNNLPNNHGANSSRIFKKPVLMRRMSRSSSRASTASTREELAFGRLMGLLCIVFLICWVPQLVTIPVAQLYPSSKCKAFFRIADILMAMHFVVDPYVYVLQRLPTFRKLFSLSRTNRNKYKSSLRMLSYDQSAYIARI